MPLFYPPSPLIQLRANLTLYVRSDGSDSNSGLFNTAAGAFLTLQAAYDYAAFGFATNGWNITIQMGNTASFAGFAAYAPWLDNFVYLQGDTVTPANTIISSQISAVDSAVMRVSNLKLASSNTGLKTQAKGVIHVADGVEFGACTTAHMQCDNGYIYLDNNYSITGGSPVHMNAFASGIIRAGGITVTLTGTPAFTGNGFAAASTLGLVYTAGTIYSGAATGTRYSVGAGATINSNGGGATYYPGSVAGGGLGTYL